MANVRNQGAGFTENANTDWVAFTAKLPQELKKKLKVIAAQQGVKQQEIFAEAVESWITAKGL